MSARPARKRKESSKRPHTSCAGRNGRARWRRAQRSGRATRDDPGRGLRAAPHVLVLGFILLLVAGVISNCSARVCGDCTPGPARSPTTGLFLASAGGLEHPQGDSNPCSDGTLSELQFFCPSPEILFDRGWVDTWFSVRGGKILARAPPAMYGGACIFDWGAA